MSKGVPIKIDPEIFSQICALPDEDVGRVMKWGWENYHGRPVDLEAELAKGGSYAKTIAVSGMLLNHEELALGRIVLNEFREAGKKSRKLSKTRSIARSKRKVPSQAGEALLFDETVIPLFSNGSPAYSKSSSAAKRPAVAAVLTKKPTTEQKVNSESDEASLAYVIDKLSEHDIPRAQATRVVTHLAKTYDLPTLISASKLMEGRAIGHADKYLAVTAQSILKDQAGLKEPHGIRKRVSVPRGARWEFLGWTGKDHPRAKGGSDSRKKIWRTDAGLLSYKLPDEGETPPEFSEDPGLYEID